MGFIKIIKYTLILVLYSYVFRALYCQEQTGNITHHLTSSLTGGVCLICLIRAAAVA